MGFALVLRRLLARWPLLVVGVLVAAIAATLSVYRLDGLKLKARGLKHSSASTQVLIDSPTSSLGDLGGSFESLDARAAVFANFMTTPAVLELIGAQVGISGDQIYAEGPLNPNLAKVVQEPTALQRNVQITGETDPYRLSFSSQQGLPTVGIDAQAPTTSEAVALANAAAIGLREYVSSLQRIDKVPRGARVTIRQLGSASGAVDDAGIGKALAAIVFVLVFVLWCGLMLVAARFREQWRASAELYGKRGERVPDRAPGDTVDWEAADAADAPPARSDADGNADEREDSEANVAVGATKSPW
jgi:hypothetical protein